MTERHRITRVKLTQTQSGKPVVELYDRDTRLRYPVLRLFDLSALTDVGLDPGSLEAGDLTHCNFWAYYETSQKTTASGRHYKDVVALESIDKPATATATDTSAIVAELRAIKALLLELVTGSQPLEPEPPDYERAARLQALQNAGRDTGDERPTTNDGEETRCPSCGQLLGHHAPSCPVRKAEERRAEPEPADLPEDEARQRFYELAGPALLDGQIDHKTVNDLVGTANGGGWNEALRRLQDELKGD